MMKTVIRIVTNLCISVCLVMVASIAHAERFKTKVLETGIEGPFSEVYISRDLRGYIKTKNCDSKKRCIEKRFDITKDVKAILDNKEVSLKDFVLTKHLPEIVYIDNETHKVSRIRWTTPTE